MRPISRKSRNDCKRRGVSPHDEAGALFRASRPDTDGIETLRRMTGRRDLAIRGLISGWLRSLDDDAEGVLDLIHRGNAEKPADLVRWLNDTTSPRSRDRGSRRLVRINAVTQQTALAENFLFWSVGPHKKAKTFPVDSGGDPRSAMRARTNDSGSVRSLTLIAKPASTHGGFSKAKGRPTCRSCGPSNSSLSSTSRPRRRLGSKPDRLLALADDVIE